MNNLVEELTAKYGEPNPFLVLLHKELPEQQKDFIYMDVSRKGVEKLNIKLLADYMGITQELLSTCLHSSFRNIQRKQDHELLDISKSERLLEITALVRKAVEVLGSQKAMQLWLQSSLPVLDYKTPAQFLDTSFGINILYQILGRIEHGVFS